LDVYLPGVVPPAPEIRVIRRDANAIKLSANSSYDGNISNVFALAVSPGNDTCSASRAAITGKVSVLSGASKCSWAFFSPTVEVSVSGLATATPYTFSLKVRNSGGETPWADTAATVWWDAIDTKIQTDFTSITSTGSLLVAVGTGGVIATSPDGVAWTPRNSGVSANLAEVAWLGSRFVIVGMAGTILTSADGISWQPMTSAITTDLHSIAGEEGGFVVSGSGGASYLFSSGDNPIALTGLPVAQRALAWTGRRFVSAGDGFSVYTLDSGATAWVNRPNSGPSNMRVSDLEWTGQKLLMIGTAERVLSTHPFISTVDSWIGTSDGKDFVESASGWSLTRLAAPGLARVASSPGRLLVVGGGGSFLSANDGSWRSNDQVSGAKAVAWSGSRFVAVGEGGKVYLLHPQTP
jgi:hypothetical protein